MKKRLKEILESSLSLTIDENKKLSEYSVDSVDILAIIGEIEDVYQIDLDETFFEIIASEKIKDIQVKLDKGEI